MTTSQPTCAPSREKFPPQDHQPRTSPGQPPRRQDVLPPALTKQLSSPRSKVAGVTSPPLSPPLPRPKSSSPSQAPFPSPPSSYDLARKRSIIIKRTVPFIRQDLAAISAHSQFLQQAAITAATMPPVALFHRSEIVTGKLLGKGGFAHVLEIVAIECNASIHQQLSLTQQQARDALRGSCLDALGQPRYALKQLQSKLCRSAREFQFAATDLATEAAFLSRLHHVNIIACRGLPVGGVDAFSANGDYDAFFIIMDICQDTLDRRIESWARQEQTREQRQEDLDVTARSYPSDVSSASSSSSSSYSSSAVPSVHTRMQLALQIARALDYLHERRIVFRDLKPSNIGFQMLPDGAERIVLLDFGLCRELPPERKKTGSMEDTFEMSGVGTRRYMAVEIVLTARYNCKADVYSWAMVVWEMLSTKKPFAPFSMEDHRQYVCLRGVRPRLLMHAWSPSICHLLQASWDQDVLGRLSIQEVVSLLQSLLDSDDQLKNLTKSQSRDHIASLTPAQANLQMSTHPPVPVTPPRSFHFSCPLSPSPYPHISPSPSTISSSMQRNRENHHLPLSICNSMSLRDNTGMGSLSMSRTSARPSYREDIDEMGDVSDNDDTTRVLATYDSFFAKSFSFDCGSTLLGSTVFGGEEEDNGNDEVDVSQTQSILTTSNRDNRSCMSVSPRSLTPTKQQHYRFCGAGTGADANLDLPRLSTPLR